MSVIAVSGTKRNDLLLKARHELAEFSLMIRGCCITLFKSRRICFELHSMPFRTIVRLHDAVWSIWPGKD